MGKNKFDYCYMSGNTLDAYIFNKTKWTKEDAIKQALIEINYDNDYKEEDLLISENFIDYGFYTLDGELENGWHIRDFENPIEPRHNSVAVWVCRFIV